MNCIADARRMPPCARRSCHVDFSSSRYDAREVGRVLGSRAHSTGVIGEEHGRRQDVAVAPAHVRRDQSAGDAREEYAAEHRRQLRAERASPALRGRDLGDDGDEVLQRAASRSRSAGWPRPAPLSTARPPATICDSVSTTICDSTRARLSMTVSQRHEEHAARPPCRRKRTRESSPVARGVGLELGGDRGEHRRLVVDAARHDEGGHDQQRDEAAMLARRQVGHREAIRPSPPRLSRLSPTSRCRSAGTS